MPKKVPSLVTHVAHLVGAMFECPNCEQVAVYSEKEVSLYGMTCNKCLQPFNIAISERLLEFCKPCQQKVRQLPRQHSYALANRNRAQTRERARWLPRPVSEGLPGSVLRAKNYSSVFEKIRERREQWD